VGVQISRRVHSQVPQEDAVYRVATAFGDVFRKLAEQKESRVEKGHLLDLDPAEIRGVA
jgi:hypothetical protein